MGKNTQRIRPLSRSELIRALKKCGCNIEKGGGSPHEKIITHNGQRLPLLNPHHRADISSGYIKGLLKEARIPVDRFLQSI